MEKYNYHTPVLKEEAISYLINNPDGIYIDGTLGGGGHTSAILERLGNKGLVIAMDKDPDAIEYCQKRFADELSKYPPRLQLYNESYLEACSIAERIGKIAGLLLDLGVSSKQIDSELGGFSYRTQSDLDMRFSPKGLTAKDLLTSATQEELERILWQYGEEPYSRKIARRIVEVRRSNALSTTFDLRDIVAQCVPQKHLTDSLSRVFQAIRIAVNNELTVIQNTLECILPYIEIHGRIVVISYHSLEDRIVKNFFKEHSEAKTHQNKYKVEHNLSTNVPKMKILTKLPITSTEQEIERNPRSRSAKLRVAERIY
ncbi:MAG: 16S rRNA (cytosine(1402)-N(4))-methyltransferase RsmH [Candidatus Kapabacteria bacterium]|nr:16S rRNA (cytosine(1402)-N(4))-methyltransferase RsmH [Candidatus Kapabacteria bacterium]